MGDQINFLFWTITYWIAIITELRFAAKDWTILTNKQRKKKSENYIQNDSIFLQFLLLQFQKKRIYIPLQSVILNLSWEIISVLEDSFYWMNLIWLISEAVIFLISYLHIQKQKNRILFLFLSVALFHFIFEINAGKLVSSFVIDIIMAVSFLAERRRIAEPGRLPIAYTKWIGDLGALFHYAHLSIAVLIIGISVAIINFLYILWCTMNKKKNTVVLK